MGQSQFRTSSRCRLALRLAGRRDSRHCDRSGLPADAVITFTAPKPAHVFGQLTRRWDQPIVVAPIGSPDEAIVSALGLHWAGSSLSLTQAPRAATANKGNFGHVLVVGGARSAAEIRCACNGLSRSVTGRGRPGHGGVPAPLLPLVAS